jgi:endonuclease/exonuclease/phosphatase family metal-dependent hydrolase
MDDLTIMTYNIEHMRDLFHKGNIAPGAQPRVDAIAEVIHSLSPHLIGVTEACYRQTSHRRFVTHPRLAPFEFQVARSTKRRGSHDLVFYYRHPWRLISIDEQIGFYNSWVEDIDDDGIKEVCEFERVPLEVLFELEDTEDRILVILVSLKSKVVAKMRDFVDYQNLALANRKRQLAQARKLRKRLDGLHEEDPHLPVIVMGDFNDEPGLDSFQRMLGASAVETIMGSVFAPGHIYHNVLWHMQGSPQKKDLWTAEYPDMIVRTTEHHKGWLDHILVCPKLRDANAGLRYRAESGAIGEKTELARQASDHFPVYSRLAR